MDVHGCPACPHHDVQGPAISASANVFINAIPALRIADIGMHMACCGSNMWKITGASAQVFVNGSPIVRLGDPTLHCGGIGKMIEASGNVVDGSPMALKGVFGPLPAQPPLPLNQVMVYPSEEPVCISPNAEMIGAVPAVGLPTSGGPQIYDEQAAEAAREANLPHAEAGPPPAVALAEARRTAAQREFLGLPPQPGAQDDVSAAKARLEAAKTALEAIHTGAEGYSQAKEAAQEAYNQALSSYQVAQAYAGAPGATEGDGEEEAP